MDTTYWAAKTITGAVEDSDDDLMSNVIPGMVNIDTDTNHIDNRRGGLGWGSVSFWGGAG